MTEVCGWRRFLSGRHDELRRRSRRHSDVYANADKHLDANSDSNGECDTDGQIMGGSFNDEATGAHMAMGVSEIMNGSGGSSSACLG